MLTNNLLQMPLRVLKYLNFLNQLQFCMNFLNQLQFCMCVNDCNTMLGKNFKKYLHPFQKWQTFKPSVSNYTKTRGQIKKL